ncbi:MAG: hypothetical protein V1860_04310 [bacterium]
MKVKINANNSIAVGKSFLRGFFAFSLALIISFCAGKYSVWWALLLLPISFCSVISLFFSGLTAGAIMEERETLKKTGGWKQGKGIKREYVIDLKS